MVINYGKKYFKKAIIFRPHNVYGPEMGWEHVIPQFILRMKKLSESSQSLIKFPIQGSGNETRTFVFIKDFVDGFKTLLKNGKHMEIYNIGSEEEITIKKVAIEVGKFFGRRITIIPGKIQKGGTLRRAPDITKIKSLGFYPQYSFGLGLQETVQWYNENAYKKPPALII